MSEVMVDGVVYRVVKRTGCKGCAFSGANGCGIPISAPSCCIGPDSPVIYLRKGAEPDGDYEWDAKFEIFERHYPLIKWAVVAGLLGLVWLVSL